MQLSPDAALKENTFEPFVYEERVRRWWWKDADKVYDIYWGNELFVNQVVEPMVQHYCEEAHGLMRSYSPTRQMQNVISAEVKTVTTPFFEALTRRRKTTKTDIGAAEKRLARAEELSELAAGLLTACTERL